MRRNQIFFSCLVSCFLMSQIKACINHCQSCQQASPNICRACSQDYELDVYGKCQPSTINKCAMYGINSQQCYSCQPLYRLQLNRCIRDFSGCIKIGRKQQCHECSFGMMLKDKKCIGIINCATYTDNSFNQCQKCEEGYSLKDRKCVDIQNGCQVVRSNDGICNNCKPGFILNGYRCIKNDYKVKNCYIYGAEKQSCLFCKNGYALYGNQCLNAEQIQILKNQQKNKQQIIIANCLQINQDSKICIKCINRFYLSADKKSCEAVSPLCNTYQQNNGNCLSCNSEAIFYNNRCFIANCLQQTIKELCQKCYPGYKAIRNSTQCVVEIKDENCEQWGEVYCEACKNGYFYSLLKKQCIIFPKNCQNIDLSADKCRTCMKDYYLSKQESLCIQIQRVQNCVRYHESKPEQCIQCIQRYYLQQNKCLRVSSLCDKYNSNYGLCQSCRITGFILSTNGYCIDNNCLNPLPLTSTSSSIAQNLLLCIKCKQKYVYSPSLKICIYYDRNCLTSIVSGCLQCNKGFYKDNNNFCQRLPDNCYQAYSSGQCSLCHNGYQLIGKSCAKLIIAEPDKNSSIVDSIKDLAGCEMIDEERQRCIRCWDGYYLRIGLCYEIPKSCIKFNAEKGVCASCIQDYILQAGACIKKIHSNNAQPFDKSSQIKNDLNCLIRLANGDCEKCSEKYYYSLEVKQCLQVNPLCQKNNQYGHCTACYRGYIVFNNSCIIEAMAPTPQSNDKFCKTVNTDINAGRKCLQCFKGYFYASEKGSCIAISPLCASSNPQNGQCLSCYKGYMLTSKGACQIFVKDPFCQQYSQNNICLFCSNRYYYNITLNKCVQASKLCKTFNASHGQCISCFNGYFLEKGECIIRTKDENCQYLKDNKCQKCSQGYFLNTDGKCQKIDPLCKTYNYYNGQCTSCYPGYKLSQSGQCLVLMKAEPNCMQPNSLNPQICEQCHKNYLLMEGKCKLRNVLCKTLDNRNGDCLSCWQGYMLKNGLCQVIDNMSKDQNCRQYQNFVCFQCNNGYFYNKNMNRCQKFDPLCNGTDLKNGQCLSCYRGYALSKGKCQIISKRDSNCLNYASNSNQCLQCRSGYYLSQNKSKENMCNAIPILCSEFNKNTQICEKCVPNYYLQNNQCRLPAIYDQNCIHYENSYCSKCKGGFYLKNYTCFQVDPDCYYFDEPRLLCYRCFNGKKASQDRCI